MTRRHVLMGLSAIMMINAGSATSTAQDASPYEWSHRPVYVFTPSADHPDLKSQISGFLARRPDLKDRQIALISVASDKVKTHLGPNETRPAQILRRTYNIGPNLFTVILVGKDTGIKARYLAATPPQDIFRQIDAMPMRLREMRQNKIRASKR